MRSPLLVAFVVTLAFAGGCLLQNMSPSERLRDAVVGYNEACRWGRMDLAQQQVDPPLHSEFRRFHSQWGRTIQIADQEILAVNAAGEGDDTQAVSIVAHRWYGRDATYIHETTLRQTWRKSRNTFLLTSEVVVDGDATLFEPMPGYVDISVAPPPPVDGGAADGGVADAGAAPTTDAGSQPTSAAPTSATPSDGGSAARPETQATPAPTAPSTASP